MKTDYQNYHYDLTKIKSEYKKAENKELYLNQIIEKCNYDIRRFEDREQQFEKLMQKKGDIDEAKILLERIKSIFRLSGINFKSYFTNEQIETITNVFAIAENYKNGKNKIYEKLLKFYDKVDKIKDVLNFAETEKIFLKNSTDNQSKSNYNISRNNERD